MLKTSGLCIFCAVFFKLFRELFRWPFFYMSKIFCKCNFCPGHPLLYGACSFKVLQLLLTIQRDLYVTKHFYDNRFVHNFQNIHLYMHTHLHYKSLRFTTMAKHVTAYLHFNIHTFIVLFVHSQSDTHSSLHNI